MINTMKGYEESGINRGDVIFATASRGTETLAQVRFSGVNSAEEVIRRLGRILGTVQGMITVTLRNVSGGWSGRRNVYIRPAEGCQLELAL